MQIYFTATIRKTHSIEGSTREELMENIASYYAEDAEPDEDNGRYYAPEASQVIRHHSDGEGDGETVMSGDWLRAFNADLEKRFHALIEQRNEPTDYQEHNTHWKGCAL